MTATDNSENNFWILETTDDTGEELNIPFTGSYEEARQECHRFHPGATIVPCR